MHVRLRLLASLTALAAGAVAIAIVANLLVGTFKSPVVTSVAAPSVPATTAPKTPAASVGFPSPPPGAIVVASEAGPNVLALAVAGTTAQVSVLGQNARGVSGADVRLNGDPAAPCGAGCYRASVGSGPVDVTLRSGGATTHWRVDVPRAAPPAATLVEQATRTYRGLHTLAWSEVFGSDARRKVTTRWQATAPDRLAYQVRGGPKAVIVGGRRWDKFTAGAAWQESGQAVPVTQPQPFWASALDAHVLGHTTFGGRPVTVVSFFDPKTPGWYRILIDPATLRTVHMDMYATAHFMHDTYFGFDSTPPVMRPR